MTRIMKVVAVVTVLMAAQALLDVTYAQQSQTKRTTPKRNTRAYRSYSYYARGQGGAPFSANGRASFGERDAGSKARGDYSPYHGGKFIP